MAIGSAFPYSGTEQVPAGKCKIILQASTEDNRNLNTVTWKITSTGRSYTVQAGPDGRAEELVDAGFTYTVTPSIVSGDYDGVTPQTVAAASAKAVICAFYFTSPALDVIKRIYPVGAIYISTASTNPRQVLGFGTWEAYAQGRTIIGDGSGYSAGQTGGEASHTLSADEMPSHSHGADVSEAGNHRHTLGWPKYFVGAGIGGGNYLSTGSEYNRDTGYAGNHSHSITINEAGGGQAHNNLPPYIVTYIWRRSA